MTCGFCRLLKDCKVRDKNGKGAGKYKTRYLSSLIKKTTYITDGEEIPSGRIKFGDTPLNYCPECGKKIDPEQVDAPLMSCHEDAYLNSLCGKRVTVKFYDDSERTGTLRRDTLAQMFFKELDDKRCIGYYLEECRLHFRKSHIKEIEEVAAR